METTQDQAPVFRIGIAMAGAVSAGAYTAGVIDYLLETLERWEQAKARNRQIGAGNPGYDPSIPMHDVVIDVIGGASAGGMTAAITTLALFEGISPVNETNPSGDGNKLYDAWVRLNDTGEASTLQQMLGSGDITRSGVPSLLNSDAIDAIADRAKDIDIRRDIYSSDWPAYISKDLELLLTICSLRGIPIEIDFGAADYNDRPADGAAEPEAGERAAHKMYLHKGVAHFTISPTRAQLDHLLRLNPRVIDDRLMVIESAKATGAFPIGLRPRKFSHISHAYLRAQIQRTFGRQLNVRWNKIPKPFSFTAVDGGTINNEPFDEVLRVLEERYRDSHPGGEATPGNGFKNYALLMIDPFPNFEEGDEPEEYTDPNSIQEAAPRILSAIRRQAMIKESELSRGFTGDHTRAMVFPVRRETVIEDGRPVEKRVGAAIACGALDGFGGFFSRAFREHDFALGRKNCQSFLRKHFVLRQNQVFHQREDGFVHVNSPAFADWKPENPMYWRFHYVKDGRVCFPIIPDLRIRNAMSDDPAENGSLEALPYPRIGIRELQALKKPMRQRVRRVFLTMARGMLFPATEPAPRADPEAAARREVRHIVNRYLGDGPLSRFLIIVALIALLTPLVALLPVLLVLALLGIHLLINFVTKSVFRAIVADFRKRNLLQ